MRNKSFERVNLRNERIKQGLSKKQIAEQLGLSYSGYRNIEAGYRNPSWEVARRLEDLFGLTASKLLAKEEETVTN